MLEKIDKFLDVPKLIKRIWYIMWGMLAFFVTLKLCFNVWYPIVVENEKVIIICDFIDNRLWLRYGITFWLYGFNLNIGYLIFTQQKYIENKKEIILLNIIIVLSFVLKTFVNDNLGLLLEVFPLIILPISKTKKWKYILICNVIIIVFQASILFVRDIEELLTTMPFLISVVLQIDYYLFLGVMYIGGCHMGNFGMWLFGKTSVEIKANIERELLKENPSDTKLAQMREALVKVEAMEKDKSEE